MEKVTAGMDASFCMQETCSHLTLESSIIFLFTRHALDKVHHGNRKKQ
jgi:hypothetical protein